MSTDDRDVSCEDPGARNPSRQTLRACCPSAASGAARSTAPVPARNVRRAITESARSPRRRTRGRGWIGASERDLASTALERDLTGHFVSADGKVAVQPASRISEAERIAGYRTVDSVGHHSGRRTHLY